MNPFDQAWALLKAPVMPGRAGFPEDEQETIDLEHHIFCEDCKGSGMEPDPDSPGEECTTCDGKGTLAGIEQNLPGFTKVRGMRAGKSDYVTTGEPMDVAFQLLKMPQEARAFAEQVHEGQMYDDENPHMYHVDAVASQFDDPHMKRIAYLHDTVEDNPNVTIDDIHERFGEDVGNAVDALTRREDPSNQGGREVYRDYIRRLAEHPEARQVKIADLKHNLSGRSKGNLRQRYEKALEKLLTLTPPPARRG